MKFFVLDGLYPEEIHLEITKLYGKSAIIQYQFKINRLKVSLLNLNMAASRSKITHVKNWPKTAPETI